MSTESSFAGLLIRIREGDPEAATQIIRDYEPAIRRSLRMRLDPRMRRVCDSMDICQAVMCSFFVRAATGSYEIESPEQLLKLLTAMARNKLSKATRDQMRAKRDIRRVEGGTSEERDVAGNANTPSQQLAAKELLGEIKQRMSEEERQLVELRGQGFDWAAVAAEMGGSAEALRKKLTRAVDRVSKDLGLDLEE